MGILSFRLLALLLLAHLLHGNLLSCLLSHLLLAHLHFHHLLSLGLHLFAHLVSLVLHHHACPISFITAAVDLFTCFASGIDSALYGLFNTSEARSASRIFSIVVPPGCIPWAFAFA